MIEIIIYFIFGLSPIALGIVSLVFGIKLLKKYKATNQKKFLVWGLILTFVIPGIIVLLYLALIAKTVMVVYAPGPGMEYAPLSPF